MENIHAETYSLLIDTYIDDKDEKHHLFNAMETIPTVMKKAECSSGLMQTELRLVKDSIAFAAVEGIHFLILLCALLAEEKDYAK